MGLVEIKLEELISSDLDSISGRKTGEDYAIKINLLKKVQDGNDFKIIISTKIKAINDSFIKGFFSKVFQELQGKVNIQEKFSIDGDKYFVDLFKRNFKILDSINKLK